MISDNTIRRVQELPAEDILGHYTKLRRMGRNFIGSCPFHDDRKPSFSVSNGLWHCFSCGKGGTPVQFVMEKEGMTWPQAIEHIARQSNIPVDYVKAERSKEEQQAAKEREALYNAQDAAQKFFCDCLRLGTSEAERRAREYAYARWGQEYCAKFGIGYAPDDANAFRAAMHGFSEDILVKAGLMGRSEKGWTYPFFRNRVTIPYRGRSNRIIAFTSRYMGDAAAEGVGKYINTRNTDLFEKGANLFGFTTARRALQGDGAAKYVIAVEGAPDAMRLHIVGLNNAVATLGTAWKTAQFELLKPLVKSICFIPDSDPPKEGEVFGPGFNAVMKNGVEAIRQGFDVTVREIPFREESAEDGSVMQFKQDVDDFIKAKEDFFGLEERHFLVWLATKKFPHANSLADSRSLITEIAGLLARVADNAVFEDILKELAKINGTVKQWREAVASAKALARRRENNSSQSDKMRAQAELLRQFNLDIAENCYYSYDGDDEPTRLSNFILEPRYHIIDETNGFRIFRLINKYGETRDIIMRESEMCSLAVFKQRIASQGNFIWRVKADKLENVKELVYRMTDSAERISILGWDNENQFYAFGNGVFKDGTFHEVDDLGIVTLPGRKSFYLPAKSKMHRNNATDYQFERCFVHEGRSAITLNAMTSQFVKVFGDNAKIGICFLLAAIFRDVIQEKLKHFPMLFLFGEKGSGKTTLAVSLQSFFLTGLKPPILGVATRPSLNDCISEVVNALTVFDEYKNEIRPEDIGFLKALWDGGGQTKKMNGKAVQTIATNAVAICGQDKPTYDEALFTRVVYLSFPKTVFTQAELDAFDTMVEMCNLGNSHLTMEILMHRKLFEQNFYSAYQMTKSELALKLEGEQIHTRVFNNWVTILAAFRVLEPVLDLPFSYLDALEVVLRGVRFQNENVSDSSEIAEFWQTLQGHHTSGKIQDDAHFVIKYHTSFQSTTMAEPMQFGEATPVIYLNAAAIAGIFNGRVASSATNNRGGWSTMLSYLKSHPCFLGLKQQRFNILLPNGTPDYTIETVGGVTRKKKKTVRPKALCFNYAMLKQQLGLSLETEMVTEGAYDEDDEPAPPVQPVEASKSTQSTLLESDDDAPF